MKDPVIQDLVDEFYLNVAEVNKTWAKLTSKGVWINTQVEGEHTYGSLKEIKILKVEETVDYSKTRKTGKGKRPRYDTRFCSVTVVFMGFGLDDRKPARRGHRGSNVENESVHSPSHAHTGSKGNDI